jgi:hypothetical protein
MPLQLTPSDRKILLIAAGLLVVMLAISLVLVRGVSADVDVASVYSTASGGCKAAFLLLQESGYRVEAWERPLSELPAGKGTTLIIAEPASYPTDDEKEKVATFLKSGGRVIATGRFAGFYLPVNDEATVPFAGNAWKQVPALSLSPITRAAPVITMASHSYWRDHTGSNHTNADHTRAVGLYGDLDKPVVVEYKVGDGWVLWLAGSAPLTNAGLKEVGNLEFLLSAIGAPEGNRVLWDEYIHGYERSGMTSKSRNSIAWIGLQLAVFAIAILATYSRRNGPVWIPQGEARLSPLEFVRTLGGLYQHANAGSVAVDIFYQRFRYLLTRRLGLSIHSSVPDLERAVRERGGIDDRQFADTLTACEACRYDPNVAPSTALRLVQALFGYASDLKLARSQPSRSEPTRSQPARSESGEKNLWKRS